MSSQTTAPVQPEAGSIIMFTTTWCGYCRRLKTQLAGSEVTVQEIDIEQQPEYVDYIEAVNGGNRTVPTVVFPDGTSATNPSAAEVTKRVFG